MAHPEPEPDSRAVVLADEADAGASDAESSKNTALRIITIIMIYSTCTIAMYLAFFLNCIYTQQQ